MWIVKKSLPIKVTKISIKGVAVTQEDEAYKRLVERAQDYRLRYKDIAIGEIEGVQDARRLFRAIGVDPTKHRPASEALLNRALKNKGFYSVNSLVDVGNWCALDFLLPTCVYDGDKIGKEVIVRMGKEGESYGALNGRDIDVQGKFILADQAGPFGSPSTDSNRSAVTLITKNAILGIYAPVDYNDSALQEKAHIFARRVQEYCGGELEELKILSG